MNISHALSAASARATPAPMPPGQAVFSYNSQDQLVFEPDTFTITGLRADGSTDKFVQDDPLPQKEGGYIYEKTDKSFHGANAFAAANRTLALFEKAQGSPVNWARAERLVIHGDEGKDLNAYYDGEGLHFFHYPVGWFKKVYSADSGEVVAHETGHAILDALRPNYGGSLYPEPGAFHEAFGDIMALLVSLRDPRVLDRVMEQTGGDLGKANIAAAMGEELGVSINKVSGGNETGGDYTRNAINTFEYQDPFTLPKDGGPDQLHREIHDFSRLWTGAFYDIFTGMVETHKGEGLDTRAAVSAAADDGMKMMADMFKPGYAPDGGNPKYRHMAAAMIASENDHNGGRYTGLIQTVMNRRKILPNEAGLLELAPSGSRELSTTLVGDRFGAFQGAQVRGTICGEVATFAEDQQEAQQLQDSVASLIEAGEVRMTRPDEMISRADLFKPDGSPYRAVVRWTEGAMTIEPTGIFS